MLLFMMFLATAVTAIFHGSPASQPALAVASFTAEKMEVRAASSRVNKKKVVAVPRPLLQGVAASDDGVPCETQISAAASDDVVACETQITKACKPCYDRFKKLDPYSCHKFPARGACSVCLPYTDCKPDSNVTVSRAVLAGQEFKLLPTDTPITFGTKKKYLDDITHSVMKSGYNYPAILSTLDKAKRISAADFEDDLKVNVDADSVGEYKIIDASHFLERMKSLYQTRRKDLAAKITDNLVEAALPHLRQNGKPVQVSVNEER